MEETRFVHVRAVPRPGFLAFHRGGHRWPEGGRTVCVTLALLRVLRAERMVLVEPMDEEIHPQPEDGVLDVNDNRFDDRAHNASAAAREQNAQLRARKAALEAELENTKLRAEIAKLERAKAETAAQASKDEAARAKADAAKAAGQSEK